MAMTKRYEVYRCGKLIGEYTAVDVAAMLRCTPGTVRSYASRGLKLYGEYTFDVMPESYKPAKYWSMTPDMEMDWGARDRSFCAAGWISAKSILFQRGSKNENKRGKIIRL